MESFGVMISGPQGDFQSPKAVWVTNELVFFFFPTIVMEGMGFTL